MHYGKKLTDDEVREINFLRGLFDELPEEGQKIIREKLYKIVEP